MKLTKRHLFLILLLTVIFCCSLGVFNLVEGMENKDNRDEPSNSDKDDNKHDTQSNVNGNEYSNNASYSDINDTNSFIKSVTLDDGRVIYATPQNTVNGIHGKNIPPGQEDLYILKSQVVPPVCPACPTIINKCTGGGKEAPPCPPCGRCPEASFECVKRPTYKADNPYLPMPVLSDFSSFGM